MRSARPAFWDASAIVPLCVPEYTSAALHRLTLEHHPLIVWWGTSVEIFSALARLAQGGSITTDSLERARISLVELRSSWVEIFPSDQVRSLAEEMPLRHHLRAGDALQLAAALVWCGGQPRDRSFVCLDRRLAHAAAQVGFTVHSQI